MQKMNMFGVKALSLNIIRNFTTEELDLAVRDHLIDPSFRHSVYPKFEYKDVSENTLYDFLKMGDPNKVSIQPVHNEFSGLLWKINYDGKFVCEDSLLGAAMYKYKLIMKLGLLDEES